jgi:hypothetical protein
VVDAGLAVRVVEEYVGVAGFAQVAERGDLPVQIRANPGHFRLRDAGVGAECLDQVVDLPGRDAEEVGVHDDGEQGLADPATLLKQRGEERSLADFSWDSMLRASLTLHCSGVATMTGIQARTRPTIRGQYSPDVDSISLVMATTQLPLSIFLYAAFMRSLPVAVEEAAVVDGANMLQVLFWVIFPMLKPVTATVIILTGVAIWNDFALSVYVLIDPAVKTIAPAIGSFLSTQSSSLGAAAAASIMGFVPVLVAYLFLQRYFIRGMVAGAEK